MTQIYSQDNAYKQQLLGNPTNDILSRYLDTVGDGSGTKNMAASAGLYFIKPPTGLIYVIDKINIVLSDTAVLVPQGFGGKNALANGCLLKLEEDGSQLVEIKDLLDNLPIKSHSEMAAVGTVRAYDGATGCLIDCELDYKTDRASIRLDGNKNHRISFETQDNLSLWGDMYVSVVGRIFKDLA